MTDKFYLPSITEIFGTDEITGQHEGAQYAYYINATNADRIKYRANIARAWRLRTPDATSASYVRHVSYTGTLYSTTAYNALGVAPACKIS